MKSIFTLLMSVFAMAGAMAETHIVHVTNFQFNPSSLTVAVGDVVRFSFEQGFHNAVSTSVPATAPSINSGSASSAVRTYDYTVTKTGTYNYVCDIHPSMTASITASGPLPVTLVKFDIASNAASKPTLTWTTTSEKNVQEFSIRSSTDGKTFNQVGTVKANGNANYENKYSFTDNTAYQQYRYVFYQLVTVDRNGELSYTPIKMFKTSFAANTLIVQLGPNPLVKPQQLTIQFNAEKAGSIAMNVYDASGRKVLSNVLSAAPGLNNGHVHICDLSADVYTLQFLLDGITETRKVVVR